MFPRWSRGFDYGMDSFRFKPYHRKGGVLSYWTSAVLRFGPSYEAEPQALLITYSAPQHDLEWDIAFIQRSYKLRLLVNTNKRQPIMISLIIKSFTLPPPPPHLGWGLYCCQATHKHSPARWIAAFCRSTGLLLPEYIHLYVSIYCASSGLRVCWKAFWRVWFGWADRSLLRAH